MEISASEKLDNLTRLYGSLHGMDGRGDLQNTGYYAEPEVGRRGFCGARGLPIYAHAFTTTEVAVRRVLEQHPDHYYGWPYRVFRIRTARERDPVEILGIHYGLTPVEVAELREIDRDTRQPWEQWCRRAQELLAGPMARLREEVWGVAERPEVCLTNDEQDAPARTSEQDFNLRVLQGLLLEHGADEPVFHYHNHNACSAMRVAYRWAALADPDLYEDWWTHGSVRMAVRRDFLGLTNREYLAIQEQDAHWRYDGEAAARRIGEILAGDYRPAAIPATQAQEALAQEALVQQAQVQETAVPVPAHAAPGAVTTVLPQADLVPTVPSDDGAAPAERETELAGTR